MEVAMTRSLSQNLSVLIEEPIELRGFDLPPGTNILFSETGWKNCSVLISSNNVPWIIVLRDDHERMFGLPLKLAWSEYKKYKIDLEVDPEYESLKQFENHLRSHAEY